MLIILSASDRKDSGDTPVLDAESGEVLIERVDGVKLYRSREDEGTGNLFLTSRNAIWLSSNSSKGISINFPHIMLHAVSNDSEAFPHPCIYCQLDSEDLQEIRFIPQDSSSLDDMYSTFSRCAAMNPDVDEEDPGDAVMNEHEMKIEADNQSMLESLGDRLNLDDFPDNFEGFIDASNVEQYFPQEQSSGSFVPPESIHFGMSDVGQQENGDSMNS